MRVRVRVRTRVRVRARVRARARVRVRARARDRAPPRESRARRAIPSGCNRRGTRPGIVGLGLVQSTGHEAWDSTRDRVRVSVGPRDRRPRPD